MHYCIFRTDRIGDVVLTLPMAEAIKRHDPSARVTFCVQEYTRPLLSLSPHIDDIIAIGGRDLDGGVRRFASVLSERKIDCAVFAYPRPRLILAAARARIPMRIGTGYRWYSPLLTHRRAEHRRSGDRHEMEYNLGLLEEAGVTVPPDLRPVLEIDSPRRTAARTALGQAGIDPSSAFIVLHPGSGGSAKDWPAERFTELAASLLAEDDALQILVTGSRAEHSLMQSVAERDARIRVLREQLPLDVLAAVLAEARVFVSNSTGPLHIAAACGVPVLGFYPFGIAVNARRWGPRTACAAVLTPPADPECGDCRSGDCALHDDMRRIPAAAAAAEVRILLADRLSPCL